MSDSMPARLAVIRWQPGHRHRRNQSWKTARRLSCLSCQEKDGGSGGLDDEGSATGDELDAVGVGACVGSVQVGEDACVGDTSAGVGTGDDEELAGVLVGVRVGVATGQVGASVLV
jgi:hypothetical protein